jgi:hypothetical protein
VPDKKLLSTVTSPVALIGKDLDKGIQLATEYLITPFCKSMLKDRTRLSSENAITLVDYVISMKREINPRPSYVRNNIQFLSELSRFVGKGKGFKDFTKNDILSFLDNTRKTEPDDPMHKWIGSYNVKCDAILRFYKWMYYCNIEDPKRRSELSRLERKPECIMGIHRLKRKEISCLNQVICGHRKMTSYL